jgi:exopolysaccharide biosynthesis polyprenyl glycosylphosphotransferase
LIGSAHALDRITTRLEWVPGVELVGVFHDGPVSFDDTAPELLGTVGDVVHGVHRFGIQQVLVAWDPAEWSRVRDVVRSLPDGVDVILVPGAAEFEAPWPASDDLYGLPVVRLTVPRGGLLQRAGKRLIDIAGAAALLVVTAPVFAAIALAIRREDGGPVFFTQVRAGRGGKSFVIYKFRTMRVGAEALAPQMRPKSKCHVLLKVRDDERVTRVGRRLRSYSLDELPQLVNVLRGDMSLVGPRPLPLEEANAFDGWAARRFEVRPGMTGQWQVSGRNDVSFDELCELDYAYVRSWSLIADVRILCRTPAAVLLRRGAI